MDTSHKSLERTDIIQPVNETAVPYLVERFCRLGHRTISLIQMFSNSKRSPKEMV